MKVLLIGGTGIISTEVTRLAAERGMDVTVLNRGRRPASLPDGVKSITADMADEAGVREKLAGQHFDAVANFIVFTPGEIERDIRLFSDLCSQYLFISSACIYRKPLMRFPVTESTPL